MRVIVTLTDDGEVEVIERDRLQISPYDGALSVSEIEEIEDIECEACEWWENPGTYTKGTIVAIFARGAWLSAVVED